MSDPVVIVAAKRTPMGSMLGCFSALSAVDLGQVAVNAVVANTTRNVDQVIMGCVLPAGLGQAPARQVALGAQLPIECAALTINKVCGSGLKAVMLAHDALMLGQGEVIVAGGMESMSNAPYLLPYARTGMRIGHQTTYDHMFIDGLENAYDGKAMGCFAQASADHLGLTREAMDAFAMDSLQKAQAAQQAGRFNAEIAPVEIATKKSPITISDDEAPARAKPDKIPLLRPAFASDGTITAANSSSISDGAAALLLTRLSSASAHGFEVLATIKAHSTHSMAPEDFTIAPIGAIQKVCQQVGWGVDDVDLFEINEAFAMVTMAAQQALQIEPHKINSNGGACALGHPIGASGARILVTLIHALRAQNKSRGVASLCIGGGEAVAVSVEIAS